MNSETLTFPSLGRWGKWIYSLLLGILFFIGFVSIFFGYQFSAIADEYRPPRGVTPPRVENSQPEDRYRFSGEMPGYQTEVEAERDRTPIESAAQQVKEKLNLDEPLPEDTKKFIRQLRGEEPIENERMQEGR